MTDEDIAACAASNLNVTHIAGAVAAVRYLCACVAAALLVRQTALEAEMASLGRLQRADPEEIDAITCAQSALAEALDVLAAGHKAMDDLVALLEGDD